MSWRRIEREISDVSKGVERRVELVVNYLKTRDMVNLFYSVSGIS